MTDTAVRRGPRPAAVPAPRVTNGDVPIGDAWVSSPNSVRSCPRSHDALCVRTGRWKPTEYARICRSVSRGSSLESYSARCRQLDKQHSVSQIQRAAEYRDARIHRGTSLFLGHRLWRCSSIWREFQRTRFYWQDRKCFSALL